MRPAKSDITRSPPSRSSVPSRSSCLLQSGSTRCSSSCVRARGLGRVSHRGRRMGAGGNSAASQAMQGKAKRASQSPCRPAPPTAIPAAPARHAHSGAPAQASRRSRASQRASAWGAQCNGAGSMSGILPASSRPLDEALLASIGTYALSERSKWAGCALVPVRRAPGAGCCRGTACASRSGPIGVLHAANFQEPASPAARARAAMSRSTAVGQFSQACPAGQRAAARP